MLACCWRLFLPPPHIPKNQRFAFGHSAPLGAKLLLQACPVSRSASTKATRCFRSPSCKEEGPPLGTCRRLAGAPSPISGPTPHPPRCRESRGFTSRCSHAFAVGGGGVRGRRAGGRALGGGRAELPWRRGRGRELSPLRRAQLRLRRARAGGALLRRAPGPGPARLPPPGAPPTPGQPLPSLKEHGVHWMSTLYTSR